MTDHESATHIIVALINNNRICDAEQACEAYKALIKAIAYPND